MEEQLATLREADNGIDAAVRLLREHCDFLPSESYASRESVLEAVRIYLEGATQLTGIQSRIETVELVFTPVPVQQEGWGRNHDRLEHEFVLAEPTTLVDFLVTVNRGQQRAVTLHQGLVHDVSRRDGTLVVSVTPRSLHIGDRTAYWEPGGNERF